MENIEIREKLAPFSHRAGVHCLVPLSDYVVQVYPAMLFTSEKKIPLPFKDPDFTVQMDLERNCVWIWDKKQRLKLYANETGLHLNEQCIATGGKTIPAKPCERLSLGNWKAQDWDLVRRRHNLHEIAPTLFLLGQKTPILSNTLITHPEHFFLAASQNLCAPLKDEAELLGYPPTKEPLLHAAYRTIRSYLVDGTSILPNLPQEWHAGRALGLQTEYGTLDLEWSKHTIRRMILHSSKITEFTFKKVQSYRCNQRESGIYLFDRFQK